MITNFNFHRNLDYNIMIGNVYHFMNKYVITLISYVILLKTKFFIYCPIVMLYYLTKSKVIYNMILFFKSSLKMIIY